MKTSEISEFYKKSLDERLQLLKEFAELGDEELQLELKKQNNELDYNNIKDPEGKNFNQQKSLGDIGASADASYKENIDEENKITVKMIIKTDTAGSLEALEKELTKLKDEEIAIELLKGGVGNINEDDARFSSARLPDGQASKKTVILGFNVATDPSAKEIIDRNGVPTFTSDIIYKISDWLKEEITKRKAEIPREEIIGVAKILKTFRESGRINYKNPAEESAVKEAYEEIMREEVDADKTFYFRNPSKSRPQESEFYQV